MTRLGIAAAAAGAWIAGGAVAHGADFTYYVSADGATNAAFTAEDPGSWRALGARIEENRKPLAKAKDVAHERVIFKEGVYEGVSLKLGAMAKGGTLRIDGESGDPEDVVFDGRGATARALTLVGPSTNAVTAITFRNYSITNNGAAVANGCQGWERPVTVFTNCVFRGNRTTANGGAAWGRIGFTECLFEGNAAGFRAGAFYDGAHPAYQPRPSVTRCTFRGNVAPDFDLKKGYWGDEGYAKDTTIGTGVRITDCTVESWSRGVPGRADGRPGVDSVSIRPGDDFEAARDRLRAERTPGRRAEIVLEDGIYPVTKALRLDGHDNDVTLRARNRGKALLTGGWTFRGGELKPLADAKLLGRLPEAVRGKVVAIDVPERWATNMTGIARARNGISARMPVLSVDGALMRPASWPNAGKWFWMSRTNVVGSVVRPKLDAKGVQMTDKAKNPLMVTNAVIATMTGRERTWDTSAADSFLFGFQDGCSFSTGCSPLGPYLPEKGGLELPGRANPPANAVTRFRFMNVFEEIDEPGEWCFDAATRKLVLYPCAGFGAGSTVVVGLREDELVDVSGDGIRVEGLAFTGKRGGVAVTVRHGRGNEIAGCRFTALNCAISLRGRENRVQSCDFVGIQANCVNMTGGERRTLDRAELVTENCLCEDFGNFRVGCATAAISARGCGCTVRHCDIHGSIEHAIDYYQSTECLIEYCRIYDVSREFDDSGAVYLSGPYAYGSVLRYNDIGSAPGMANGIYLDDFCCGVTVYGNILRNVGYFGIFLGGGRDLTVENNVITACWGGLRTDNRGLFWPAWKDKERCWASWCKDFGLTNGTAFAKKYDRFAKWWEKDGAKLLTGPVDCAFRNNLMVDIPGYSSSFFVCLKRDIPADRTVYEDNLIVRTTGLRPGASDLATGDMSKAATNKHSSASLVFRPLGEIRVLDGTPENPIDLGFVKLPKASFNTADYMFEQQGWVDTDRLRELREKGACTDGTDLSGDFTLKENARLLDEMPGFKPIPFRKIGLYRDAWRTDSALPEKPAPEDVRPWWKFW